MLVKLEAWSLTLRRFCPPDERHVPWSRVRVENYPYHLTHTLVKRLTPDLIGRDLFNAENPIRSGLKFYNLHQTLNTSINALNSFTDIYLISSARSGFVFFISFTNFFLTFIVPLYPILPYLSSLVLGACCLSYANMWRLLSQSLPEPTRLATWSSFVFHFRLIYLT